MNLQENIKKKEKRILRGKILVFFIGALAVVAVLKKLDIFRTNIFTKIDFSYFPRSLFPLKKEVITPLGKGKEEDLILYELQNQGLKPAKVSLRGKQELGVVVTGGIEVFFDLEKDISEQVASLQMIVSRFKIEGKQPKKIDLRFEKPIISF